MARRRDQGKVSGNRSEELKGKARQVVGNVKRDVRDSKADVNFTSAGIEAHLSAGERTRHPTVLTAAHPSLAACLASSFAVSTRCRRPAPSPRSRKYTRAPPSAVAMTTGRTESASQKYHRPLATIETATWPVCRDPTFCSSYAVSPRLTHCKLK